MAFWINVASLPASGSLEYFRVIPWSFAACSAPFRILSQKVSPGASWVTIAMVYFFPSDELFCAPPWLLQAASAAAPTATTASVRSDLREPIFIGLSSLLAACREATASSCGNVWSCNGPGLDQAGSWSAAASEALYSAFSSSPGG